MKNSKLEGKVHSAAYHQCQQRGYVAPTDVLVDIGVLLLLSRQGRHGRK